MQHGSRFKCKAQLQVEGRSGAWTYVECCPSASQQAAEPGRGLHRQQEQGRCCQQDKRLKVEMSGIIQRKHWGNDYYGYNVILFFFSSSQDFKRKAHHYLVIMVVIFSSLSEAAVTRILHLSLVQQFPATCYLFQKQSKLYVRDSMKSIKMGGWGCLFLFIVHLNRKQNMKIEKYEISTNMFLKSQKYHIKWHK